MAQRFPTKRIEFDMSDNVTPKVPDPEPSTPDDETKVDDSEHEERTPRQYRVPTYEEVHRDIALGNNYRIELSKLLLALAAGLFAFSVAFQPATFPNIDISNLESGWYALAISMAGGMGNLYGWEKFYLSYRDYDLKGKQKEGKEYRSTVTFLRRIARFLQFAGFLIGAGLIGYFTSENIKARPVPEPACAVALINGGCPDVN